MLEDLTFIILGVAICYTYFFWQDYKNNKEIKIGLKGYKYLDEAIELANELGLALTDAEIVRTNSTGLTIYNPKNLADRIKGMKNKKEKSRAEKIAERLLYEKQSQVAN